MKYLALMRDSLREVIDAKIFIVMVFFSLLLIGFLGSISYRPVTVEEEIQRSLQWYLFFAQMAEQDLQQGAKPKGPFLRPTAPPTRSVQIIDFKQTNDAKLAWRGDYQMNLVVTFDKPQDIPQFNILNMFGPPNPFAPKLLAEQFQVLIQKELPWLSSVQVEVGQSAEPKEVLFRATLVAGTNERFNDIRTWPHEPCLFFGTVPIKVWHATLSSELQFFMDWLVGQFGSSASMLLATVVTAFFIPNMLRKGTVDLLIVKPIHRSTLLLFKFLGGVTFMFLNTVIVVFGVWLVIGQRSGIWANSFLLFIFVLTYQFAIYYSFSTLFAVMTRSPIVAILMTCLLWLVLFTVGSLYSIFHRFEDRQAEERDPAWVYDTVDTLHYVLPRVSDLTILNSKLIINDIAPPSSSEYIRENKAFQRFAWGENLIVSGVFIGLMLGLSCWWFSTKDY